MARWRRAWIGGSICVALSAAPGLDQGGGVALAQTGARRLVQGGEVRYLFSTLPDGSPILGGGHQVLIPSEGGREPIDAANQPARLHPDLRGPRLVLNPEIRAGATDARILTSSWWPQSTNGIADRWNSRNKDYADFASDPDNLAPTEKYDLLFHPGQGQRLPEVRSWTSAELGTPAALRRAPRVQPAITVAGPATAWELQHHGLYQQVYPEDWFGHCNGWAAYASTEPDGAPRRDVRVRLTDRAVVECDAPAPGCVLFRMADIEALMTELYFSDSSTMAGRRCNIEPDKVRRDRFGRPVEPECRDLNPGTLHVALTGLLGVGATPLTEGAGGPRRLPFLVDHSWANEVWSFPIAGFAIDEIEEVSRSRAAQLVCAGEIGAIRCRSYEWNRGATRFARVRARYSLVRFMGSGPELLTPAERRPARLAEESFHYVLEMDGAGRILGGEWIRQPGALLGANGKELHPDFLWMSVRPQGFGEDRDDLGGGSDNPFIAYSKVKALLTLSRTPARGAAP